MTPNVAAAKAALSHLEIESSDTALRSNSRDFFWYSPVLKARLDHVVADFVIYPKTEAEVIEILATCHAHDCPVTTRGAGTGITVRRCPWRGAVCCRCAISARSGKSIPAVSLWNRAAC